MPEMEPLSLSFLIIIAVFALRGAMLSLVALVARILGLILSFTVVLLFNTQVADTAQSLLFAEIPLFITRSLCAIGLFLVTMLVVKIVISAAFKLLGQISAIDDKPSDGKNWRGRCSAAILNAGLGGFLFIFCLSVYQSVAQIMPAPALAANDHLLLQLANKLGQQLRPAAMAMLPLDNISFSATSSSTSATNTAASAKSNSAQPSFTSSLPPSLQQIQQLLQQAQSQQARIQTEPNTGRPLDSHRQRQNSFSDAVDDDNLQLLGQPEAQITWSKDINIQPTAFQPVNAEALQALQQLLAEAQLSPDIQAQWQQMLAMPELNQQAAAEFIERMMHNPTLQAVLAKPENQALIQQQLQDFQQPPKSQ